MGSQSDAVVLLAIFSFYLFIIFMMGLIGGSVVSGIDNPNGKDIGLLNFWSYVGFFIQGIGFSLSSLGVFNIPLFAPLGLTLLYLLLKLFRGGG